MRRAVVPFIACLCCLWSADPAHAQKPPQQKPQQNPAQAAAALVSAGKYEDALAALQKTLAMAPTNRDAVMVKIDALVGLDKIGEALDSYQAFIAAKEAPRDAGLARHLAQASLRRAAAGNHPDAQPAAVELLRAAGESAGTPGKTTGSAAKTTPGAPVRDGAAPAPTPAVRAGGQSPEDILAAAASPIEAKRAALDRLTAPVSPKTQELVRAALKDRDQWFRLSAAYAVKRLDLRAAVPELRAALKDDFFPLKLAAAATLREWGDKAGDEVLYAALKADFLAGRLPAARALKATGDTSWPPQIAPLLESPRANERVAAAELLLPIPAHAPKAREVLKTEMSGKEVPLRREAIRALSAQADADPWNYLLLMRDADPVVRVYAAGVLMRKLDPASAPAAAARSPR